jgi:hypothetical protein
MTIDESTGDLKHEGIRLEHRGTLWEVSPIALGTWVIRGADGLTAGTLVLIAPEGEERDPVYGGCLPGETEPLHEGSDWGMIVRALINEALDKE